MIFCRTATEVAQPSLQLQFRTYNIVPEDSQIVKAALNQDVGAAPRLFSLKEASPYDRTELGLTLVEYTTRCLHPMLRFAPHRSEIHAPDVRSVMNFVRLLIDCGVDPAECSGTYG